MSELKKIGTNSVWMVFGYVFRILSAFITSIFVARYLGPSQFGEMNYVFSFVVLFSVFTGTCFDSFLRREFVAHPEKTGEYLGSAICLKLTGSIVAAILVYWFVLTGTDSFSVKVLLCIYSASLFFSVGSISQILLEAHLASKYVSISEFIQLTIFLVLKLIFVWLKLPLWAFIILQTIGLLIKYALNFYWIYSLKICPGIGVSRPVMFYLMRESWPLFLSSGAVMIYQHIDQVMLHRMVSSYEVGQYAVAVKISNMFAFLPLIISTSLFPSLVEGKKRSEEIYEKRLIGFTFIMFWPVFLVAVMISLFIYWPCLWFYGEEYLNAVPIVRMLVWKCVFLSLARASSEWMIIEGLQKYAPVRQVSGMLVNVGLNFALIPILAGVGAGLASVLAAVVASVVFICIVPVFRPFLRLLLKSLNPVYGIRCFREGYSS